MAQVFEPIAGAAEQHAAAAGLRYVTDEMPGYGRRRRGKGFVYLDERGTPIRDDAQIARIRALAIPPAWIDVWICPSSRGHIQATGRDARGRKQYRYHPRWRAVRDETKFDRMIAFGEALPALRARVDRDLRLRGLPREKVIAAIVRLLDRTLIRVGNDEYARDNGSFGLTTIRKRHVEVNGGSISFEFEGKSGKKHAIDVTDPRAARIVRRCRDLPGHELFKYIDETDERRGVGSEDVNDYLREVTGQDFTAKDFRTWGGTVLAARALREVGDFCSERHCTRNVNAAIEAVASMLGNTRSVCRASYVHPEVIGCYEQRTLEDLWTRSKPRATTRMRADEVAVLRILKRLARTKRRAAA